MSSILFKFRRVVIVTVLKKDRGIYLYIVRVRLIGGRVGRFFMFYVFYTLVGVS